MEGVQTKIPKISWVNMKKSLSELIDELITTNIKIFFIIENILKKDYEKEDAKKVQELNFYRSRLKNAINQYFNERQEIKL